MGLNPPGIAPSFKIIANDVDVTSAIKQYLSEFEYTDSTGDESDTLSITLASPDPSNPVRKPATGAQIEFFLGYDGSATRMGLFIYDEVSISGYPEKIKLTCRAAAYAATPKGMIEFQTQKTRTWKAGTVLGAMVTQMAKEHGMTAAVSASLAKIVLPHKNQDSESDINFLLRMAKLYDAVTKPAGGILVFAKRGEAKTLSGVQLPTATIDRSMIKNYDYDENTRDTAGTAVAYYHVAKNAKRTEVKVGTGEPVRRIRYWFSLASEALAAAQAVLARANRRKATIEINLQGYPDLMAEQPLVLTGFHPDIPANWIITRVRHVVSKQGAYTSEVSAELPNDPSADQFEVVTDADDTDA